VRVNKDVPGFIVNRVQAPGGVLLRCILDEGIAARLEGLAAKYRKEIFRPTRTIREGTYKR